jgi:hypothetical protein
VAVLVVVAVVVVFFVVKPFKTKVASPEDQIKAVVQHEADGYNAPNYTYNSELVCRKYLANDEKSYKEARKLRSETGTISLSVTDIHVNGDQATAQGSMKFEKLPDKPQSQSMQFVKEDGKWKDCTPPDSSGDGDDGN